MYRYKFPDECNHYVYLKCTNKIFKNEIKIKEYISQGISYRFVIPSTQEAETRESQIQGSLGSLARICLQIKTKKGWGYNSKDKVLCSIPSKTKQNK